MIDKVMQYVPDTAYILMIDSPLFHPTGARNSGR